MDTKKISMRYKTLEEDMEVIKKIIKILPEPRPPFSLLVDRSDTGNEIVKVNHVASKCMKGSGVYSGLNLIYSYRKAEAKITLMGIYLAHEKTKEEKILRRKH